MILTVTLPTVGQKCIIGVPTAGLIFQQIILRTAGVISTLLSMSSAAQILIALEANIAVLTINVISAAQILIALALLVVVVVAGKKEIAEAGHVLLMRESIEEIVSIRLTKIVNVPVILAVVVQKIVIQVNAELILLVPLLLVILICQS